MKISAFGNRLQEPSLEQYSGMPTNVISWADGFCSPLSFFFALLAFCRIVKIGIILSEPGLEPGTSSTVHYLLC